VNLLIGLLLAGVQALSAQIPKSDEPALHTAQDVISRMLEADQIRATRLLGYTSRRRYLMESKRFGKPAEMTVRFSFRYPDTKSFEILSEQGPPAVRNRVFRRMLETEVKAAKGAAHGEGQISPRNYNFKLLGSELLNGRGTYLLEAAPKTRNPYLFRGRIWIDAKEFSIVRIEGRPTQNPSFWIRKSEFVHEYKKVGQFWLAALDRADTEVYFFGEAILTIEYTDYRLDEREASR
jgi:hypothetical protein